MQTDLSSLIKCMCLGKLYGFIVMGLLLYIFSIIMLYIYTFTKDGHIVNANYWIHVHVHCFTIDIDVCILIVSSLYTIFKFICMQEL